MNKPKTSITYGNLLSGADTLFKTGKNVLEIANEGSIGCRMLTRGWVGRVYKENKPDVDAGTEVINNLDDIFK